MPKKILYQHDRHGNALPFSAEDRSLSKSFKENKITTHIVSGVRDERSAKQIRFYFVCCKYVADNVREYPQNDPKYHDWLNWSTKALVDISIRRALHFIDDTLTIYWKDKTGKPHVMFQYLSIAYENLSHLKACDYFNRAIDLMAVRLGVSKESFVRTVQRLGGA